ncbi:MAG: hypothetical protein WEA29_07245 [Acidimicrobiia bacterium]
MFDDHQLRAGRGIFEFLLVAVEDAGVSESFSDDGLSVDLLAEELAGDGEAGPVGVGVGLGSAAS